jgi:hypothetical protein
LLSDDAGQEDSSCNLGRVAGYFELQFCVW